MVKSNQLLLAIAALLTVSVVGGLLIAGSYITLGDKKIVDDKRLAEISGDNNASQNSSGNNSYFEKIWT